jgi:hypothetical protein
MPRSTLNRAQRDFQFIDFLLRFAMQKEHQDFAALLAALDSVGPEFPRRLAHFRSTVLTVN